MESKIQENNKRLLKNTGAMYCRTFIVLVVSLYITRVILKELGETDYGVYNLVGSIVVLFSFLNTSLTQAIQRFITIEVGKNDIYKINTIFNISFLVQIFVAFLVFFLCESVGLFVVNNYIQVGNRINAANWVFQFSVITTLVSILRIPFEALVVANEKMSFYALVSIIEVFLKLLICFFLALGSGDKLILYSFLLAGVSLISFAIYIVYCKMHFVYSKIKKTWDAKLIKQILSFSGWSLLGSVSNLATMSAFTFLINVYYGVLANAALGIANQVYAAVNQFIGNFQSSFRPQIIKSYAANEFDYFMKLIFSTSKLSYLLILMPVVVLIFNMPLVLTVWLGNVPKYTVEFCQLILVCSLFDGLTGSYYCAITATGKIRKYQIALSCSFLLDLVLSISLMSIGIQPEKVLYSRIATRGVLNMLIGLFFMEKLINFQIKGYVVKVVLPITLLTLVLACSGEVFKYYFTGWNLLLLSIASCLVLMIIVCNFILSQSEKNNIKLLWKKIKK